MTPARSFITLLFGVTLGGVALLGCAPPSKSATFPVFRGELPTNVLWVSIDTLRRSRLGPFGNNGALTPFLDSLMRDGVLLADHHSCSSWTWPSVLCATRGIGPMDLDHVARTGNTRELPPSTPTVASAFRDAGYSTLLITSNTWLSDTWGSADGYQYVELPSTLLTEGLFGIARSHIEEGERGQPWFAHVHVREPHHPYTAPDDLTLGLADLPPIPYDLDFGDVYLQVDDDWDSLDADTQTAVLAHLHARYDAELRWLDQQLAAVFEEWDRAGLLDDTLVVIWSDHGEQFFEHGHLTHAFDLHPEENDALGLVWARNIEPGVWREPTVHGDLGPTTLTLMGVPVPDSMTGLPVGSALPDRPITLFEVARTGAVSGVIQEGFKLIYGWGGGRKELYDRVADPGETASIYDPEDPQVVAMWDVLLPQIERIAPLMTEEPVRLGP